jgi:hypothetical protein
VIFKPKPFTTKIRQNGDLQIVTFQMSLNIVTRINFRNVWTVKMSLQVDIFAHTSPSKSNTFPSKRGRLRSGHVTIQMTYFLSGDLTCQLSIRREISCEARKARPLSKGGAVLLLKWCRVGSFCQASLRCGFFVVLVSKHKPAW